jgi:GNAT superfamily N-acetyltransferase
MPQAIAVEGPLTGKSSICEPILRALPEWFGVEEAIVRYVREIDRLPTFLVRSGDEVIGFLTLKLHNAFCAELLVMGIRREWHRHGAGRSLVRAAERYLRRQDIRYFQVKTLGPSQPNPNYARTRAFYFVMGFRPLEEIVEIWDEQNPCLVMVKYLRRPY